MIYIFDLWCDILIDVYKWFIFLIYEFNVLIYDFDIYEFRYLVLSDNWFTVINLISNKAGKPGLLITILDYLPRDRPRQYQRVK